LLSPDQVKQKLLEAGLQQEDAEYLTNNVLTAKGIILVADSSLLAQRESPDIALASYLDTFNQYAIAHGRNLRGIALLFSKYDKFMLPGYENPSDTQLQEIAEKHLPKVYDYILRFGKRDGTVFKIFYSKLKEEIDRDGCPKYTIYK
jgi:hypothetical protein